MTTVNPSTHKCCALCIRWDGDAGLTNQGVGRGLVRFSTGRRGTCALTRQSRGSNEGTACRDYSISPEASRYSS